MLPPSPSKKKKKKRGTRKLENYRDWGTDTYWRNALGEGDGAVTLWGLKEAGGRERSMEEEVRELGGEWYLHWMKYCRDIKLILI